MVVQVWYANVLTYVLLCYYEQNMDKINWFLMSRGTGNWHKRLILMEYFW